MYVVSIKVEKRNAEVPEVQEILTKYGDGIETRLGIHTSEKQGIIIAIYSKENVEQFVEEINEIGNVSANHMKV